MPPPITTPPEPESLWHFIFYLSVWLAFLAALFNAVTGILGIGSVKPKSTEWPKWVWLSFGFGLLLAIGNSWQIAKQLQDADLQKRTAQADANNVQTKLTNLHTDVRTIAKAMDIPVDQSTGQLLQAILGKLTIESSATGVLGSNNTVGTMSVGQTGGQIIGSGNQGIITSQQNGNNTLIQNPQRHLTQKQIASIATAAQDLCNQKIRISVTAANSNNEAQIYAADFIKGFIKAGCDGKLELPIPGLEATAMGVLVGVRPWPTSLEDLRANNPSAYSLLTALSAASTNPKLAPLAPQFFEGSKFILAIGGQEPTSVTR